MVIGSIPIPSIPNPLEHQSSIPQKINRVASIISKPPPLLFEPHKEADLQTRAVNDSNHHVSSPNPQFAGDLNAKVIAPALTTNSLDKSNHGGAPQEDQYAASSAKDNQMEEGSNLAKAFLGKLDLQPCHQILGKPCVSFSMEDKKRLISSMNYILVVKFSHFRPKFHEFNSFMVNMKFLGKFRIFEFDLKYVFVEFLVFEDFIKIWMLKSCMIGGFRGRLFQWDSDVMPSIESSIAPIWVHLPHFPLYLFNDKAILSVASVFGKPIFIDSASLKRQKVGRLSVCVAKDVRVKGPSEIMVEFVGDGMLVDRFTQVVTYGEIPDHCSKCLHMGRCIFYCKASVCLDNSLGAVSSRLQEVENEGLGTEIPVVSVFNRLSKDMAVKDKLGAEKMLHSDMVLMEDITGNEDKGSGFEHSALGVMPKPHANNSFNIIAPSFVPNISEPGAVVQEVSVEVPCMLSKDDVQASEVAESVGEELALECEIPADALLDSTSAPTSATFVFGEPSLDPHNFLCGDNGGKALGVLETRVNNLQVSSIFEPLAAVDNEEIAVENCVLQEYSADCVEEAILTKDISMIRNNEKGKSTSTDRQVSIIQNAEEIRAKSPMVCSEIELEKRVWQNSAADSNEEATLREDFSQLVHDGSEIPSVSERQGAILQDAEKIKAKALVVCPEKRLEDGDLLQSATDFNEKPTLRGHISASRDNQAMYLGATESSLKDLQNDASLDLIATVNEEISGDEDGGSSYAVSTLNEHISSSGDATDLILGPTESQEDNIQVKDVAFDKPQSQPVESLSSEASKASKAEEQVALQPAAIKDIEQNSAKTNRAVNSPSSQISSVPYIRSYIPILSKDFDLGFIFHVL